ncbi:MAG: AMP-binding protein [Bacteroidota bacterium]
MAVNYLHLNEKKQSFEDIKAGDFVAKTPFEQSTLTFCRQWLNGQATFSLKTSGSTGEPKTIEVTRKQMQLSARQTVSYFNLTPEDTVLVCLNTAYIAGIMMLVRGFESGAKIIAVEPEGNPLNQIDNQVDFLAVVPLQLNKILSNPVSKSQLENCRATLVGGAPVSVALEKLIAQSSAAVYATFAMTETLTHFALRQLNPNKEEYYTTLKDVSIGQDNRGCLTVESQVTLNKRLFTNDLVEIIAPGQFIWKGRIDNIINSGGVKVSIETLESKIEQVLSQLNLSYNFFIAGLPDSVLGEKVVLIVESSQRVPIIESIDYAQTLNQYEIPKSILYLPNFIYTPTGKINRPETTELV